MRDPRLPNRRLERPGLRLRLERLRGAARNWIRRTFDRRADRRLRRRGFTAKMGALRRRDRRRLVACRLRKRPRRSLRLAMFFLRRGLP